MISAEAIRGHIDIMVLSILQQRPSYAYELAKTIADVSGGTYTIKQTTLYSAVKRLESVGQIESYPGVSESGKPRTYYQLTESGRAAFLAKCREWEATKAVIDHFAEGVL